MNKRQKLVQERFLDNEEAVIKKLETSYETALADITKKSQSLYDDINRLDALAKLATDDDEKAKLLSQKQAKVYQKQYQDALKKQVSGILDTMHAEEFKTVSDYLQLCYEDAFVGTMFDMQGQGIPLCFPLDQESMVRAVQLDSKISEGLYNAIGENVAELKKSITAEVARGIATGASFSDIARNLRTRMTGDGYDRAGGMLYRSKLIARTEGHRIQCQATMDACHKAKEKGADVVKQWDATLDAKTRDSHAQVDGEIRELDKPFSNGLMFPGDPVGGAAEVCNCRCALLQRARWALDEDELKVLQERAAHFGLDKSDSFEEYKKNYLKAAEGLTNTSNSDILKEKETFINRSSQKSNAYANDNNIHSIPQGSELWTEDKRTMLRQSEKILNGNNYETAVIYDSSGNVIFKKKGNSNSVSFTKKELKQMQGAVITHNHPKGSCPSTDDIMLLKGTKAAEIRTSTRNGTFVISSNGKWHDDFSDFKKIDDAYNKCLDDAIVKFKDKAAHEGKNLLAYLHDAEIEGTREFCKKYGLNFRME